jgi:hypothetical protein
MTRKLTPSMKAMYKNGFIKKMVLSIKLFRLDYLNRLPKSENSLSVGLGNYTFLTYFFCGSFPALPCVFCDKSARKGVL